MRGDPAVMTWALAVFTAEMTSVVRKDGLVALALAFLEFELITTVMAALGVGLLLTIGVAKLWALYSLFRALPTWPRDVAIAQLLVALLAIYIVFTAARGYGQNWWTLGIAAAVGVLAIGWILRVWRGTVSVQPRIAAASLPGKALVGAAARDRSASSALAESLPGSAGYMSTWSPSGRGALSRLRYR